jgi:thioesterase domain-containing protein
MQKTNKLIKNLIFSSLGNGLIKLAIASTTMDTISHRYVKLDDYQIYTSIYGKSAPVVIFEAGLGDDSTTWDKIAPQVAKFAKVMVYDRTGLGKSQSNPANKPIPAQDTVNTLRLLLTKQQLKPPYILVGHSLGGLIMQLFAQEFPQEVAGLVLIDSVSRNQTLHDSFPGKQAKYYLEAITFEESQSQVKKTEPFPAIPVIVITATNHPGSLEHDILWQKWQDQLVRLSPKGMQILAWNSAHYIQREQPELVVDAIATIIKMAKLEFMSSE